MRFWLFLFYFGLIGLLLNIGFGWELIQNPETKNQWHLVTALSSLTFVSLPQIIMLIRVDTVLRRLALTAPPPRLSQLNQSRFQAMGPTYSSLGLSVLSLITGTMANPGQLPILHLVLGLGLFVISSLSAVRWTRLFSRIRDDKATSQ